jgi:hypothetical protein
MPVDKSYGKAGKANNAGGKNVKKQVPLPKHNPAIARPKGGNGK